MRNTQHDEERGKLRPKDCAGRNRSTTPHRTRLVNDERLPAASPPIDGAAPIGPSACGRRRALIDGRNPGSKPPDQGERRAGLQPADVGGEHDEMVKLD